MLSKSFQTACRRNDDIDVRCSWDKDSATKKIDSNASPPRAIRNIGRADIFGASDEKR